ncbi:hypothetical protein B0T21DRAFT_348831 [Apiosordaria backusii]|uniref:Uncharacterized protein n=1 Tax=Apiosordaria backusii TaxID=314023 RepID=A0AA40BJI0_9PEZI|nr:hypothetical protein B0T21DRAFT_348831 [Apiosordaria backusii]
MGWQPDDSNIFPGHSSRVGLWRDSPGGVSVSPDTLEVNFQARHNRWQSRWLPPSIVGREQPRGISHQKQSYSRFITRFLSSLDNCPGSLVGNRERRYIYNNAVYNLILFGNPENSKPPFIWRPGTKEQSPGAVCGVNWRHAEDQKERAQGGIGCHADGETTG